LIILYNVAAALLCVVGLVGVSRCVLCNFDPGRVRVGSVIGHLAFVVPTLFVSGLSYTAGMMSSSSSFGHVFGIGRIMSVPLALVGAFICIVPALFAMGERRHEVTLSSSLAARSAETAIKSVVPSSVAKSITARATTQDKPELVTAR